MNDEQVPPAQSSQQIPPQMPSGASPANPTGAPPEFAAGVPPAFAAGGGSASPAGVSRGFATGVPPAFPSDVPRASPPPADDPADLERPLLDQLLRSPGALLARLDGPRAGECLVNLALIALAGHALYGLVVGSFSGGTQWWAAPLKISLGTLLCGAFCFPSLFIFVSQSAAQTRARHVLGMLLGMLASTAVLLAGFAPVAWIFSQSSNTISLLAPLHYLAWFVSLLASARFLKAGLQRWHAKSSALTALWMMIFIVTCLQMTTSLRPILGRSERLFEEERKLFLLHWGQTIYQDANGNEQR